ncbi:hypothetical protein NDU88_003794 [Pleurodeles waltl]|uniref:Uncharacterized protein n=1 Tax=Pleurodeles waltl TaxID=8319 RepID=A0AAV7V124_PLEWA|nr:hypothetical protein NDU88_003794 [Pleurodeles waltl]
MPIESAKAMWKGTPDTGKLSRKREDLRSMWKVSSECTEGDVAEEEEEPGGVCDCDEHGEFQWLRPVVPPPSEEPTYSERDRRPGRYHLRLNPAPSQRLRDFVC